MNDRRTEFEKLLWKLIGPPLYYCAVCKLRVAVKNDNGNVVVKRSSRCDHNGEIIAPRKAMLFGKGGANLINKTKVKLTQIASSVTGRSV